MNHFKTTALSLLALALVGACASRDTVNQTDVNEKTFFRQVKLAYDAKTELLDVYMDVRVGGNSGTTVRLDEKNIPKFEGQAMKVCDSKDAQCLDSRLQEFDSGTHYYAHTKVKNPKKSYQVTWFNANGSQDVIDVPMAGAIEHSPDVALAWSGEPNQAGEDVRVGSWSQIRIIYGQAEGSLAPPQQPNMAFNLEDLVSERTQRPENITYAYSRSRDGDLHIDGRKINGSFHSIYYTAPETVQVEPKKVVADK
jgi:hypothetical protein